MRRTTATVLPATIGTAGCAASIWVRTPACRLPHPSVHQRKYRLNASWQPSGRSGRRTGLGRRLRWTIRHRHIEERRLRDDDEVRSAQPLRPAAGVQVAAVDHPGVAGDRLGLALLEQLAVDLHPARTPREPIQMDDREPELLPESQRRGRLARTRPTNDDDPLRRPRSVGQSRQPGHAWSGVDPPRELLVTPHGPGAGHRRH